MYLLATFLLMLCAGTEVVTCWPPPHDCQVIDGTGVCSMPNITGLSEQQIDEAYSEFNDTYYDNIELYEYIGNVPILPPAADKFCNKTCWVQTHECRIAAVFFDGWWSLTAYVHSVWIQKITHCWCETLRACKRAFKKKLKPGVCEWRYTYIKVLVYKPKFVFGRRWVWRWVKVFNDCCCFPRKFLRG